jgi:hypothetical protein
MADVISPLVWDGSTLSIPRASSTQDGYLSRDDFILFSGGTVVPVTSFNTRTGEVILLDDDVLAALGYVPLNKHGDTMTGPLLLPPGNPATLQTAAHKAYVDASVALAGGFSPGKYFPRTWWLVDFNASGSGATFTGSITAGSSTLTLTSATHDFAVGQGIAIQTAGDLQVVTPGSNLLVSRITAISGATITLADAATHTATSKTVQHDDTVALQTAINTAFAGGGGTIICDAGHFRLNGPLTDFNSIIKLPYILGYPPASAGIAKAIAIVGPPLSNPGWNNQTPDSVTMFQSDRIGTSSDSCLMTTAAYGIASNSSFLTVYMENLLIRIHDNPQISGLDFRMGGTVHLLNVSVDTQIDMSTATLPTHGTFGLGTPLPGVGIGSNSFDMVTVMGFHIGIRISETFNSNWFIVARCYIGMESYPCSHVIYGNGQLSECAIFFNVNGHCPVDMSLDFQSNPASWWSLVNDINDPGNNLTGLLRYTKISYFGATSPSPLQMVGGQNCNIISLDALGTTLAGNITNDISMLQDLDVGNALSVGNNLTIDNKIVTYGANDTAGAGFRPLRIPNSAAVNLASGLISYWKMDEATGNRVDQVGGVNTFTVGGTLSSITGKLNAGASGAGAGYLIAADHPSQHPSGSFSICGWLLIHNLAGASGLHMLLNKWASNNQGFIICYDNSVNVWKFVLAPTSTSSLEVTVSHTPTAGTWYHLAAVYDATNTQIRLRVNDGAVGAASSPFPDPPYASTAGALSLLLSTLFSDAAVDELGWWNRALNSAEISALYNGGGTPPAYPFP